MQGTIAGRQLSQPRSLGDAVKMLRDEGPLVPLAGCTDLYVALNFGTLRPTRFLNLWNLDTLRGIETRGTALRIGALDDLQIITSAAIRRRLPRAKSAACRFKIAARSAATWPNASPAGDTLPVLLAADAVVVLRSAATRRVPMTAFYTGYRQSVARPDELIVGFEIPALRRQWFRKVGTRAAQAIAKIVVAGVWDTARADAARADARPRLAMGSVAPTPLRLSQTERVRLAAAHRSPRHRNPAARDRADRRPAVDRGVRRQVAANLLGQFVAEARPRKW